MNYCWTKKLENLNRHELKLQLAKIPFPKHTLLNDSKSQAASGCLSCHTFGQSAQSIIGCLIFPLD